MKNAKPFILGCMAGCGLMFVALQYHVVQSHDGMQLVPRAPKATLGLAWVDVRDWDAETWSERPEVARALVAHGSSDLIAESVARKAVGSEGLDSGTIGQLRSLLNEPMSTDFDAPLFEDEKGGFHESNYHDSPAIPFPNEANSDDWDDLFSDTSNQHRDRTDVAHRQGRLSETNTDFNFGFGKESTKPERRSDQYQRKLSDPLSDAESLWRTQTRAGDPSNSVFHETTILEDLFGDETDPVPSSTGSRQSQSRFDSLTRALESRASNALDRAGNGFTNGSGTTQLTPGSSRSSGVTEWSKSTAGDTVPDAIRALREGYDPFAGR